jgi:hypothetical protein
MPWSPVPKFPEIIKDIKWRGYADRQFPVDVLEVSIMKITGIIKPATLKQTIIAMERLGYVTRRGDFFTLKKFSPKDIEAEADGFLKKFKRGKS